MVIRCLEPRTKNQEHAARNRAAFTALEMLAVILIASILIAMIVPAVRMVQRMAEKHRAAVDANALVQAVMHYRQVYGSWPAEQGNANGGPFVAGGPTCTNDFSLLLSNTGIGPPDVDQAVVLSALSPTNRSDNPRGVLFLEVNTDRVIAGRFVDPWNQPYLMVMNAGNWGFFGFSNLAAFAISAGAPAAYATASNWIFSAGARP